MVVIGIELLNTLKKKKHFKKYLLFWRNFHSGCINLHPTNSAKGSLFSTSSLAFIVCRIFDDGNFDWYEVTPHCNFDLNFSNNTWATWCNGWLTGKDLDAGKNGREEKRATEDKLVGWHHPFIGHELWQTLGDGEGEGSLASWSPWGCKLSDTTWQLNTTNNNNAFFGEMSVWDFSPLFDCVFCFSDIELHESLLYFVD